MRGILCLTNAHCLQGAVGALGAVKFLTLAKEGRDSPSSSNFPFEKIRLGKIESTLLPSDYSILQCLTSGASKFSSFCTTHQNRHILPVKWLQPQKGVFIKRACISCPIGESCSRCPGLLPAGLITCRSSEPHWKLRTRL